jgi:hypothetical protein
MPQYNITKEESMEHWKQRQLANGQFPAPGQRNIRPIVFKNQLIGSRPTDEAMNETYPWLAHCKYEVIKEVFVPNGDYVQESGTSKRTPKGTLTLVIEIFNENQSPTS